MKTGSYKIGDFTIEPPDHDNEIEIHVYNDHTVYIDMYDLQNWLFQVIGEKENEQ